jgi:hypothetical protein
VFLFRRNVSKGRSIAVFMQQIAGRWLMVVLVILLVCHGVAASMHVVKWYLCGKLGEPADLSHCADRLAPADAAKVGDRVMLQGDKSRYPATVLAANRKFVKVDRGMSGWVSRGRIKEILEAAQDEPKGAHETCADGSGMTKSDDMRNKETPE